MSLITLRNIMIWDGELTPSIANEIELDPTAYAALNEEEKWIQVGKWKIKIDVKPAGTSGFEISGNAGNTLGFASSGKMFLDESFFSIATTSNGVQPMGSARGCFEINW